jgi:hypothetical protein
MHKSCVPKNKFGATETMNNFVGYSNAHEPISYFFIGYASRGRYKKEF